MKIDDTNLNQREKDFFNLLCQVGMELIPKARKTNVTQNACHSITFDPESGYLKVVMYCNKKVYEMYRFDQFPEMNVEVKEDLVNHRKGTPDED